MNWKIAQLLSILMLLIGCGQSEEALNKEAERVAQGFSIAWQNEDYGAVYEYLVPELQTQRSKEDFINFVIASQSQSKFSFIYDKAVLQDKSIAYAYYTFSGDSIFQPKTPAVKLERVKGTWRINGFVQYFTKPCVIDDCEKHTEDLMLQLCLTQSKINIAEGSTGLSLTDCQRVVEKTKADVTWSFKCDNTTGFVCKGANKSISELQPAKSKILTDLQINSALKLGRESITHPEELLLRHRTEKYGTVVGQGVTFLTPQLWLAFQASQKELTPEEIQNIASQDSIYFIADTYGESIDFNSAVNAVITLEDGTTYRPISKAGKVTTSNFWPESPAYWSPMIFTFNYPELKDKKFTFSIPRGEFPFDLRAVVPISEQKRPPLPITCQSFGCPKNTAFIGNLRGNFYACTCDLNSLKSEGATNNTVVCFESFGEAVSQDYREIKGC